MEDNNCTFDHLITIKQKEWEDIWKQHRLTFVTHFSAELVEYMENLYLVHAERGIGYHSLWFAKEEKAMRFTYKVGFLNGGNISFLETNDEIIESDGRRVLSDYIKSDTQKDLVLSFFSVIGPWLGQTIDELDTCFKKEERQKMEERYAGATVEGIVEGKYNALHLKLSNGETVSIHNVFKSHLENLKHRKLEKKALRQASNQTTSP